MAKTTAKSPSEYLKSLPEDRKRALEAVRKVILKNLPKGFEESMAWGVPTYAVPLETFSDTYNGQPLGIAALANKKDYMTLHLPIAYMDPAVDKKFREAYIATGKKLDMGKGCVRFKKLEDLPLEVVGKTISSIKLEKFLEGYRKSRKK